MTNETIDIEEQEQEDLLYEHFRMEVDKGQVPIRIDKYLVEHQPHSKVTIRYARAISSH